MLHFEWTAIAKRSFPERPGCPFFPQIDRKTPPDRDKADQWDTKQPLDECELYVQNCSLIAPIKRYEIPARGLRNRGWKNTKGREIIKHIGRIYTRLQTCAINWTRERSLTRRPSETVMPVPSSWWSFETEALNTRSSYRFPSTSSGFIYKVTPTVAKLCRLVNRNPSHNGSVGALPVAHLWYPNNIFPFDGSIQRNMPSTGDNRVRYEMPRPSRENSETGCLTFCYCRCQRGWNANKKGPSSWETAWN